MNKDIRIFEHEEFGEIRVMTRNGDPWFVGNDVARSLGYADANRAIRDHCKGGCILPVPSDGGIQGMKIIPESDLYRLILRSKLPQAEAFQDWVVCTVLPSIRKHGAYMTGDILAQIKANPRAIGELILKLANEQDKREELESREEIWGTRTPWGEISERTGKPRTHVVHGYPRSSRRDPEYIITTTVTETQLRLFNPYEWE